MSSLRRSLVFATPSILALALACTEPEQPKGSVRVEYSTAAGDYAPFVWLFSIEGRDTIPVRSGTPGWIRFDSLSPGPHQLATRSLPAQCTTGADERTIEVPAGDTLRVALSLTCTRTTGDVKITVGTTGAELDPNGYGIQLDGVAVGSAITGPSVPVTLPKVAPGAHTISLTNVASNCTVTGGPTFPAVVTAGQLTTLTIEVVCVAVSGTLRYTTITSGGANIDPNGYSLRIDARPLIGLPSNGTGNIPITGGTLSITLGDIEPNCTADSPTRTISAPAGATTDIAFNVTCGAYALTVAGIAVVDPANDTLPNPANNPTPSFDLAGLSTSYGPGFMTLTLKFTKPLGASALVGYVDFDIDENVATGSAPVVNFFGSTMAQGVDGRITFDLARSPAAEYSTTATGVPIRIIAGGDSVRFILPNERMNDDGNVTISAIVGSNDRPTDYVPNGSTPIVSHRPAGAISASSFPALMALMASPPGKGSARPLPVPEWRWPPR